MTIETHPETALVPYVRGELSPSEHESVRLHLDGCDRCRAEAAALTATLDEVSSRIEELPTPEWTAYRRELRLKLDARNTRRHGRRMAGLGLLTAAGAAMAALIVLLVRPSSHPVPPMEELAMEQELGASDLGLLRDYSMIERLDLLENYDVIEHLDEVTPAPEDQNDLQS